MKNMDIIKLKKILNWEKINSIYKECFLSKRGRSTKKTDLSLGLILLKHLYRKPDSALIEELHLNNDVPESIRKSSIADKLWEKKEELNIVDSAIYGLNNKEKIEKLRKKRINSLKRLLSSIKLGMFKLDDIDWKRIIAFFIDRIEVHSLGRINKTSKLDVYVHYNFNSLAAENIGKIIPRWANGGIGRCARFRT